MKPSIYIDTDVIFDVLSVRTEHLVFSSRILDLCEKKIVKGYSSVITVVNCSYLMERYKIENRLLKIDLLCRIIEILPCNKNDIRHSIDAGFIDFEDGVQNSIAENSKKCGTIITRNTKDFEKSKLQVMTPENYIRTFFSNGLHAI